MEQILSWFDGRELMYVAACAALFILIGTLFVVLIHRAEAVQARAVEKELKRSEDELARIGEELKTEMDEIGPSGSSEIEASTDADLKD